MEEFKKFKEEEWYDIWENKSIYDFLVEQVKNNLIANESEYSILVIQDLWKCESPIEQLLFLEICKLTYLDYSPINPYVDISTIEIQKEIQCEKEKYRVDFLIPVEYTNPKNGNVERKFYIVECDGHEFHEKTKEQVIRDNKRIRKLQEYGYQVIRYSGSEIYHMAYKCALNLLNIIYGYFWKNIMKED